MFVDCADVVAVVGGVVGVVAVGVAGDDVNADVAESRRHCRFYRK